MWLGTPCDQCDADCNNYTANVPLAWGPPPAQHDQQDVLRSVQQRCSTFLQVTIIHGLEHCLNSSPSTADRSCSQKLSALSALQAHQGVSVRVTRRRRSKASSSVVTPGQPPPPQQQQQQQPATGPVQPRRAQAAQAQATWPQRQGASQRSSGVAPGGSSGAGSSGPSGLRQLSGLRGQPGGSGAAGTSLDEEQEAETSDGGKAHWRRGQLR